MSAAAAGCPAMTARETRLADGDKASGRHWSRGDCWCGAVHSAREPGLWQVLPPWDAGRAQETGAGQ